MGFPRLGMATNDTPLCLGLEIGRAAFDVTPDFTQNLFFLFLRRGLVQVVYSLHGPAAQQAMMPPARKAAAPIPPPIAIFAPSDIPFCFTCRTSSNRIGLPVRNRYQAGLPSGKRKVSVSLPFTISRARMRSVPSRLTFEPLTSTVSSAVKEMPN